MIYEDVKSLAAMAGLVLFIAMFVLVLIYVFWPGNQKRFERARNIPLQKEPDDISSGEQNGR